VQVDVKERTVALSGSFETVRSAQRFPLGGEGYYEIEILERDSIYPQYGFVAAAFARVLGASDEKVGDDRHSWAVVDENRVCVFITAVPNTKLCAWGEEDSGPEDICYERRRAEACAD
jgi:hypothetical protein